MTIDADKTRETFFCLLGEKIFCKYLKTHVRETNMKECRFIEKLAIHDIDKIHACKLLSSFSLKFFGNPLINLRAIKSYSSRHRNSIVCWLPNYP